MSANYEDVRAQLAAAGLLVDRELALDARIQRWKTEDGGHERRGWSRLREVTFDDGNHYIIGAFGVWHGNDDGRIKVAVRPADPAKKLSTAQIAAIRAAQKETARKLDEERKLEAKTAARWAAAVWDRAAPASEHEYTTRKRIQAHGLRVLTAESLQHEAAAGGGAGRAGTEQNAAGQANSLSSASTPTTAAERARLSHDDAADPLVGAGDPAGPGTGDAIDKATPRPAAPQTGAGAAALLLPGIDESNWYRLTKAVGALVVPMHDANANVCGVQFIYPKGHERAKKIGRDKEFWPAGMAMAGTFGLIGHINRSGLVLIAEGYATAASLHEATGQTVAYAFSANNVAKAAKLLRQVYKRLRLLFCADDDYLTEGNPGVAAAVAACAAFEHAAWIKPDFTDADGNDQRNGKKLTDFNDLAVLTGLPLTLANQVNAKLDALKWRDPQHARGEAVSGERGGDASDNNGRRAAQAIMGVGEVVARFVPLDDGTGKYVFDTWTNKVAHRDQMIALLPAGVRGDDVKRHPVWIERGACYLDEVGFDPTLADAGVKLNTWRGWPRKPKAGKCELLLDLLRYLCSEEPNVDEVYRWILCWMAWPLQHPGAKMFSAIIMHGPQGTGKSTVFETLAEIYGDYSTVLNQRGLEDKFNADWSDSKLFILAEEVVTRQEMWHIKNELKQLVTGKWIRVNPKNIAAYRQRNQVNICYLSNENQPLPIENDDRRHLVVYTPPALPEAYFDELYAEIENGGIDALYQYLLDYDTAGFHPKKKPPMTEAKQALMALASPSELRFINDWVGGELGLPVCPARSMDVYAAYKRWCQANGEVRPRPSNQFLGTVGRMAGWERVHARIHTNTNYTGATVFKRLLVPPVNVLQAAGREMKPDEQIARFYTDGAVDFAGALHQDADRGYG
jgi:putative DNA primase/helicase